MAPIRENCFWTIGSLCRVNMYVCACVDIHTYLNGGLVGACSYDNLMFHLFLVKGKVACARTSAYIF